MADTDTTAPGRPSPAPEPLPVLYQRPQLVNDERHRATRVAEVTGFGFARDAGTLPLGANELFVAQAHYPIVFTASDPIFPVAVLGIGRNFFIDDDGRWRSGTYIPAYIRRYPFILGKGDPAGPSFLAIDEAAQCLATGAGRPLYEDGQPSSLSRQALEFCLAFEMQLGVARNFAEALRAAGVLALRHADVRFNDGVRMTLDGFHIIDEARFDAVPNETFMLWRRNGWLGLMYAQLMSMRKWDSLPLTAFRT